MPDAGNNNCMDNFRSIFENTGYGSAALPLDLKGDYAPGLPLCIRMRQIDIVYQSVAEPEIFPAAPAPAPVLLLTGIRLNLLCLS